MLAPLQLDLSAYSSLTLGPGTVGVSPPLYSRASAEHFHCLLLALLEGYQAALDHLRVFDPDTGVDREDPPPGDKDGDEDGGKDGKKGGKKGGKKERKKERESKQPAGTPDLAGDHNYGIRIRELNARISVVISWGKALCDMVYSPAMEQHLATIILPSPYYPTILAVPPATGPAPSSEDAITDGDNADFTDIQPDDLSAGHAGAYRKWLRLLVNYFRSIKVLLSYVSKRSALLSLRIIFVPPQTTEMYKWKDLLVQYKKFPSPEEVEGVIKDFTHADTYFAPKGALSTGVSYGTVHCEATLATFYYLSRHKKEVLKALDPDMVGVFEVEFHISFVLYIHAADTSFKGMSPIVGVSKRCCLVCDKLFSVLYDKKYTDKLDRPPPHQMVFPCSLPEYLPKGVVDEMLETFKGMLLKVLETAVANEVHRKSIDSHNSQVESSDTLSDIGLGSWQKTPEDMEAEFVRLDGARPRGNR